MLGNKKKVTILGAGKVGASIAYTLVQDGMCTDIVLIDMLKEKAKGEVLDLRQGAVFCPSVKITDGEYEDATNSDIVIVTIGVARKPGQTRMDLAAINVDIVKKVMPNIVKYAPNAIYVVVSNPVDILTYALIKYTDLKPSQVIGSGTLLDTIRLSSTLSDYVGLTSRNVHSYVFGEHGDSSMVPWSLVTIAGAPIKTYCKTIMNKTDEEIKTDLDAIEYENKTSGATIIKLKGATYYAIALTVRKICDAIFRNADTVIPVSSLLTGHYGLSDLCMSVPCVINSFGVKKILTLPIEEEEQKLLNESANAIKETLKGLSII